LTARRYLVSGSVQGVGFRYFAVRAARALALRGWVRNLPDGRVEVLAEGDAGCLEALRSDLGRGPIGSSVEAVEEHPWNMDPGVQGFEIRF
jgi:acylphosphatase